MWNICIEKFLCVLLWNLNHVYPKKIYLKCFAFYHHPRQSTSGSTLEFRYLGEWGQYVYYCIIMIKQNKIAFKTYLEWIDHILSCFNVVRKNQFLRVNWECWEGVIKTMGGPAIIIIHQPLLRNSVPFKNTCYGPQFVYRHRISWL